LGERYDLRKDRGRLLGLILGEHSGDPEENNPDQHK
jgi:hypothetical protein